MGWWHINYRPDTDDVIGDTPADILGDAFEHIAQQRTEQGREKPRLQEILDTLTSLLGKQPKSFYAEGGREEVETLDSLVLWEGAEESIHVLSTQIEAGDEQLAGHLEWALREIVEAYTEYWDRFPRLREVLALFAFVLLEDACSDEQSFSIQSISAQTRRCHPVLEWWRSLCRWIKELGPRKKAPFPAASLHLSLPPDET